MFTTVDRTESASVETYLSGYSIVPLPDNWMPAYISQEAALKRFSRVQRFYGLKKLVDLLH